ncbi:MAG TPA: OmpA family protein [Candidatus Obscuribacterales bacterium]
MGRSELKDMMPFRKLLALALLFFSSVGFFALGSVRAAVNQPAAPSRQADITDKLWMIPGMTIVFPIQEGLDTRWKKIGDYSFTTEIEYANESGYSYRWRMSAPARASGIRAVEAVDVKNSHKVSFFYPYLQTCTLVGYTNIVRISDALYSILKAGGTTDFELDGPDSPLRFNREILPLPHEIRGVGEEEAEVFVNDQPVVVRAIKAETDNGWLYWILDNPRFPIMIRGQGPFLWDKVQFRHASLDRLLNGDEGSSEGRRIIKSLEDTGEATTRAILFDFDKAVIKPQSKPILNALGFYLKNRPSVRLAVEGHTCTIGGYDYNMDLSRRRANAVKAYLVQFCGIDEARLEPFGYGYTKPVESNSTSRGRALNRRVVFKKLSQ